MYVCGAKYLSITEGNIYKFLFIDGIIGMILSVLLQAITYNFRLCDSIKYFFYEDKIIYCDSENKLNNMIKNLGFEEFGGYFAIPNILALFFEIWIIWLTIFNFTPNHFSAIYSIPLLIIYFISEDIDYFVVYIIGNIIIFFMTLVYNEIIILKFCGFDKNTSVEINKRSKKDSNCDFEEIESANSEQSRSQSRSDSFSLSERSY